MFKACPAALTVALFLTVGTVRAADLDPYLPADTESYVSINVRQLLDSDLMKKSVVGPLRDAIKNAQGVTDVLEDLGFDPFKHFDRLTIATPSGKETDRGLFIAYGTFDLKKFQNKAADAAQNNEDVLKIHKVKLGGLTHDVYEVVVPGHDLSVFVALANNKTLLASPGKDYVVDALKQARARKKPVLKNKAFQAILEKMDPKQGLSLAVLGKTLTAGTEDLELLPKGMRDALANIEVIGGGLTVGNEFKLELAISTRDDKSAVQVRNSIDKGLKFALVGLALLGDERKELNLLLEVIKTIKVTGKAKVVAVSGKLTADVLGDFFKKAD